jgi:choline dehydrogenase-like flavoprotein
MGRDPKTSVLNEHNQAHDVKNLFMTDGACMASNSCVNPSLTYMRLTDERLFSRLRKRVYRSYFSAKPSRTELLFCILL